MGEAGGEWRATHTRLDGKDGADALVAAHDDREEEGELFPVGEGQLRPPQATRVAGFVRQAPHKPHLAVHTVAACQDSRGARRGGRRRRKSREEEEEEEEEAREGLQPPRRWSRESSAMGSQQRGGRSHGRPARPPTMIAALATVETGDSAATDGRKAHGRSTAKGTRARVGRDE